MATTKTTITTWGMRLSARPITASTTSGTTRATSTSPSTTPMTMLTSTIAWCTPCVECARRAHWSTLVMSSHASSGASSVSCHNHLHTIHGAPSLTRFSLSSSTFSPCPSPSTSSTPSCTLSSTTRSSWKACAAPPTRRVRTPTTSPLASQVMSPNSWPSASSTTHWSPSPSWSRPRTKTWMTWHLARCSLRHTEDKPVASNQKACQSVSRRLLCSMDQGNLMERNVDQSIGFGVTRNTYSAHSKFSENTRTEKMVDRSGQPDERNSSNAQIRTLLEEQRQTIIVEYHEKVCHHELHAAHAEEERRLLQGQLWRQKLEFREVLQQSLTEMEELRKFQSSAFDTLARRKLIEDQNTILEKTGRVQELQNEVNCVNDSQDFQDAESVRSGNSHVTSRPMPFSPHPIPEGMLRPSFVSPRRKEGPPCIWGARGVSGNVFANPVASSSARYPQELDQWGATIEEPLHDQFRVDGFKCILLMKFLQVRMSFNSFLQLE